MRYVLLSALLFMSFSLVLAQNKSQEIPTTSSLAYLTKFNGEYPQKVKLFTKPQFVNRVKALVGSRYKLIQKYWNVESPIEIESGYFKAEACRAHECPITNFLIIYNFTEDKMYVGIRENEKTKTYSENGENIPMILKEWAKDYNLNEMLQNFIDSSRN